MIQYFIYLKRYNFLGLTPELTWWINWSAEIKELERLYESFKGQVPDLEKELERLIKFDDPNAILLYSWRCLEVIITDLCTSVN